MKIRYLLAYLSKTLAYLRGFRLALAVTGCIWTLSGCTSPERVRSDLLQQTPIGSTIEMVQDFCVKKQLVCKRSDNSGYLNQDNNVVVGTRSVWTTISRNSDRPMIIRSVSAYWGFDENGRLLDIWVWITYDAP